MRPRLLGLLPVLALLAGAESPAPARPESRGGCSHGQYGVSGGVRTCLACGATQVKGFPWVAKGAAELAQKTLFPLDQCSDAIFAVGADRAFEAAQIAIVQFRTLGSIVQKMLALEVGK